MPSDAPEYISINAPKEAKPGDVITVICKTERSNPASEITWVIDGRPIQSESDVLADSVGGWVTSSTISVNITEQVWLHIYKSNSSLYSFIYLTILHT